MSGRRLPRLERGRRRREEPGPTPAFVEEDLPFEPPPRTPREPEPVAPETDPHAEIRQEVVPGPTVGEMRITVHADDDPRPAWWVLALVGAGLLGGLSALVAALTGVGPAWLDQAGAVAVVTTYSWALAERTGGRPTIFGLAALGLGGLVVTTDSAYLRTGAAVMTCVVSAVLAVMVTVPARRLVLVARECLLAVLVAGAGALATVGFAPTLSLSRFEFATLVLSLAFVLVLVYRLGAGWHGLGPRGLAAVLAGGALLTVLVVYAELLRRYGPPGLVGNLLDGVRWSRENLGAFPRPILAGLGIPALAWGIHMRTRRRQGWWLCAFGVAGTAAVANSAINPAIALRESALSVAYALVVGLVIAVAVIRVDLALSPGSAGGRRARRAGPTGEVAATRPEPPRTAPLL